jgi:hypothetical protein
MSVGHKNGWRQHIITLGCLNANAVNAARRGNTSPAMGIVIGASEQPKTFENALLKLVNALPEDVPPYRITNGRIYIPSLKWGHHRGFHKPRTAELHWLPCWGIESAKAA